MATAGTQPESPAGDDGQFEALVRELESTLALIKADELTLAYALFTIIERGSDTDRPRLIRHAAYHWGWVESSGEYQPKTAIAEDDKRRLEETYSKVVDSLLDVELTSNPPEEEFYVAVDGLIHNPIFRTEDARAFALYWILIDNRIPYFQLEQGLRLTDEDFQDLSRKLRRDIAKLRFILSSRSRFEQRSEEADLLLREIDLHQGVERVRLMAYILWDLRAKTDKVLDAVKDSVPVGIRR